MAELLRATFSNLSPEQVMAAEAGVGAVLTEPLNTCAATAGHIQHQGCRGVIQQADDVHWHTTAQLPFNLQHEARIAVDSLYLQLGLRIPGSHGAIQEKRFGWAFVDQSQKRLSRYG